MSNPRILVVDDEPQIRRVMRTTLIGRGYIVSDAKSGEEALEKLHDEKPDLILLDMNMPGMGGLAACRAIRGALDVPIIILSVRSAEKDKVEALDAGADDYITKPFSTPELLARIRASLRRTAPADAARQSLTLEDVTIDLGARVVLRGDKSTRLTPKEFDLLQYFISNPNEAIPHGRLLQAVWGPDYGDEVEYLRVFVNQLRKKIEPEPSNPRYITTEPWVGYRFRTP